MHINFSPTSEFIKIAASLYGNVLTINEYATDESPLAEYTLDFAPLTEGATLPEGATGCPWISGSVTRVGGTLHLTLILPHGSDAPYESRFPEPITVTQDGPIALPPYDEVLVDDPIILLPYDEVTA